MFTGEIFEDPSERAEGPVPVEQSRLLVTGRAVTQEFHVVVRSNVRECSDRRPIWHPDQGRRQPAERSAGWRSSRCALIRIVANRSVAFGLDALDLSKRCMETDSSRKPQARGAVLIASRMAGACGRFRCQCRFAAGESVDAEGWEFN